MNYFEYFLIIYGSIMIFKEIIKTKTNSCNTEKGELENKIKQLLTEREIFKNISIGNTHFIDLSKLLQHYEE